MNLSQALKMAIKSILSNKKRAFLTMLGIMIGIGSVIGITGIIQGVTNEMTKQFDSIGVNLLTVAVQGRSNSNRKVTYSKLKQFEEQNQDIINAILPSITGRVTMKYQNSSEYTTLEGILPAYEKARDTTVTSGRFINDLDVSQKKSVVIIGTYIKNEYFKDVDAVGEYIKINGQLFEIVGVSEEKGTSDKNSADNKLFIPYTSAVRLLKNANIDAFLIWSKTTDDMEEITSRVDAFLYGVYGDTDAYYVVNPKEILDMLGTVMDSLQGMLIGIAGISLIVGGVGIMNIMLVSITERTREIGIRKAIGASKKSIMILFLIEAGLLSGIGGIAGVVFGEGLARFAGMLFGIKSQVTIQSVGIAVAFSVGIGMFFGWSPANKAANLKPVEALRTE